MSNCNPETVQDRAFDLLDTWQKHGCVMFRQQRAIYSEIAKRLPADTVLDVGCGNGIGTALLGQELGDDILGMLYGADKILGNVEFAKQLYPWIEFFQWDAVVPFNGDARLLPFRTVVCVEMLEHVADPLAAMRNLLAVTCEELWLSTPNGNRKPKPPSNPHHVAEYTPMEVITMIADAGESRTIKYEVLGWEDFQLVPVDTLVDPLVYHVTMLR